MSPILFFIIIGVVFVLIRIIKVRFEDNRNNRKLVQKRLDVKNQIKIYNNQIEQFNKKYTSFINQNKYLGNFDVYTFTSQYISLRGKLSEIDYKCLDASDEDYKKISSFIKILSNIKSEVVEKNKRFVDNEFNQTQELLSQVEGRSLDNQQREAVIINQDNQLIVAGAGSGKTTTIAGKVKYLTQRLHVKPENILLISFTRKSADEMQERIKQTMGVPISVNTFHGLGLSIIAEANNEKPSVFDAQDKQYLQLIQRFIDHHKQNTDYFNQLIDFLSYDLKPYKDPFEFNSDSENNSYLEEQKNEGFRIVEKINKEGIKISYRERFKSQEEVLIANFLFRNRINYEYEEKYQYKTASKNFGQYKPDFYLPDYNIYIEHFGIDKNGNVPKWFKGSNGISAQQKYTEGIEWKRLEHSANGTTLVETYSWQKKEGILLSTLESKLKNLGVEFNPISNDEMWKFFSSNNTKTVEDFTRLLATFLTLLKSNNESIESLEKKASQEKNQRAVFFLSILEPIYNSYESNLKERDEIDFSDMINKAIDAVKSNQFISKYDYIIIDEFQDISKSRYQLVKALLDQKPDTKLFCVGDDWQSIYRFTGSDIGIFTDFENYFKTSSIKNYNRGTHLSYIEHTYRFDNMLIDLSSKFILKNPNQIKKALKSAAQSDKSPYTFFNYSKNGFVSALENALDDIIERAEGKEVSVLLLGRYSFEKKNISQSLNLREIYNKNDQHLEYKNATNLKISFLTVHSSKGLQGDYVIILNGNSGTFGFPSEVADDPLLNFLLSKADQFPNGEERRVFYVALTRAKKHVYILSDEENTSKFLFEFEQKKEISAKKCPWCDNGRLIVKNGLYGYFYGCSNVHYCNYTRSLTNDEIKDAAFSNYNLKKYLEAIPLFEKYLINSPNDIKSIFHLAHSYQETNQLDSADKNYSIIINAGNNIDPLINYWKGYAYLNKKEYVNASSFFEKSMKTETGQEDIYAWLAFSYFLQNKVVLAINTINKEISLNPSNSQALYYKKLFLDKSRKQFSKGDIKIKTTTDYETFKNYISFALDFGFNIKFNYHKSIQFDNGGKSLRTIKPKEFKVIEGSDCIVGYCYMRKEDRTFNIGRITNLIINPKEIEFWSE